MAIDPVCKMEVDISNTPGGKSEHGGKAYYFCAPGCKRAFDKEPQKYAAS
ncbi:MAG: YHS domain-containing protein [SAR202 cluster bacterium]|nr:YHS domain-containing protein [SAR202 cluster bacterium]